MTRIKKILFLHGWEGSPNGTKIQFLRGKGHDVTAPELSKDDFEGDVKLAQKTFDEIQPAVVVGSSRGGAIVVNIETGERPVVLIAPAWKHWGSATTVGSSTTILHSANDDLIPLAESCELLTNSGLDETRLIIVGDGHRMSDERALAALADAVERADSDR